MIDIRYAQVNLRQPKDFVLDRPTGVGYYDLVFFKSKIKICVNGEMTEAPAGSLIIYDKTCRQYYYSVDENLLSDFIHFETDDETVGELLANLPLNVPFYITQTDAVERLIWLIAFEYFSKFPYSQNNISHIFIVLLKKLKEDFKSSSQKSNENYPAVSHARSRILQNPQYNWTIKELAESCNMSESYFQIIYKKLFGTNCISDVIASRLEMARRYLLISPLSIQEIAERCGYNNVEHFTRQFKKEYAITPLKYRKTHKHISQILPEMETQ